MAPAPNYAVKAPHKPIYMTPYQYPGFRGRSLSDPPPVTKNIERAAPVPNPALERLEAQKAATLKGLFENTPATLAGAAAAVNGKTDAEQAPDKKKKRTKKSRRHHHYRMQKKEEKRAQEPTS